MYSFGFIGAGKVGQTFGRYLKQNGYLVSGYFSRTWENAKLASEAVGGIAYRSLDELLGDCDVVILTVNDGAIKEVAKEVLERYKTSRCRTLAHMSGALTSMELNEGNGAYNDISFVSVHPMQSFANIEDALLDISGTVFGIEGDTEAASIFEEMLEKMRNPIIKLTSSQKTNYHLSAVVASNYLVTLFNMALETMAGIGIDEKIGVKALLPLIQGTLKNVEALGPAKALTGPIARGDYTTVAAHLAVMEPEAKALYKHLGRATLKLAAQRGLEYDKMLALEALLKED